MLVLPAGPGLPHGLVIPAEELDERFSRSSGPGGQGVNTTDSRVELRFDASSSRSLSKEQRDRIAASPDSRVVDGVVVIVASEHRSQRQNRKAARERLGALLRQALAPPPPARRPTRPTAGSRRRRLESKARRGQLKVARRRIAGE